MIKLNYLTTNDFTQYIMDKMLKNYHRILTILWMVSLIAGFIAYSNKNMLDIAISFSLFTFFITTKELFKTTNKKTRKTLNRDLITEEFTMNQESFTLKSIYTDKETIAKVNISAIQKVIWSDYGFAMLSGVMIYFVQNGEFESGSMNDIYEVLKNIPKVQFIRY